MGVDRLTERMILPPISPRISQATKSHSKYYLGVDPGREGASVLLCDRVAVAGCSWKVVKRKKTSLYQIKMATPSGLDSVDYLPRRSCIGFDIVQMVLKYCDESPLIAIEDVYFGRNVRSCVSLARMGGMIAAPLEQYFFNKTEWVMAPEWRQKVLGMKRNSGRDTAKAASLSMIPKRIDGVASILSHIGTLDNITDAAGIAEWRRIKGEAEDDEVAGN